MCQVAPPSGGAWGSTYVDAEFGKFIAELMGVTAFAELKKSPDWIELLKTWEDVKLSFNPEGAICLPRPTRRSAATNVTDVTLPVPGALLTSTQRATARSRSTCSQVSYSRLYRSCPCQATNLTEPRRVSFPPVLELTGHMKVDDLLKEYNERTGDELGKRGKTTLLLPVAKIKCAPPTPVRTTNPT